MKPQYKTGISKKITVVKVFGPVENKSFINARFKISLLHQLLKDKQKFEPIIAHMKQILVLYIHEVSKVDVEIAYVLHKKPTVLPKEPSKDLEKMKLGRIRKDDRSMAFQL
ncbi:unnamed protein product [Lactuca saligna]|uniref:Uncharacterized protein n=1 Tax=Lactuca saligna TaxID=75948 RepID=A0AA35UXG3_LACSI|nr:unnamed protein product [Lactuca saligna]